MPWIDELSPEVIEQLPPEITDNESLNRYNSIADLAKSHLEQRAAISQSIRIPPQDAGEEARQQFLEKLINNAPEVMLKPQLEQPEQAKEFYRTLGLPEEPDKYQKPEDVDIPAEVEAELRTVLHEANLTQSQFDTVMRRFAEMDAKTKEAMNGQFEQGMEDLKGKWGMTLEERMKAAKKINDEFYPGRDFEKLGAGEVEALYNIHTSVTGKGAQAAQQPKGETGILPPAEAVQRANEIMNNPAYWDRSNPQEQKRLVAKRLEYLKMAGYSDDIDELRAS